MSPLNIKVLSIKRILVKIYYFTKGNLEIESGKQSFVFTKLALLIAPAIRVKTCYRVAGACIGVENSMHSHGQVLNCNLS